MPLSILILFIENLKSNLESKYGSFENEKLETKYDEKLELKYFMGIYKNYKNRGLMKT